MLTITKLLLKKKNKKNKSYLIIIYTLIKVIRSVILNSSFKEAKLPHGFL